MAIKITPQISKVINELSLKIDKKSLAIKSEIYKLLIHDLISLILTLPNGNVKLVNLIKEFKKKL
jgi:hypothetical protein